VWVLKKLVEVHHANFEVWMGDREWAPRESDDFFDSIRFEGLRQKLPANQAGRANQ
jgi:hypothetical protein